MKSTLPNKSQFLFKRALCYVLAFLVFVSSAQAQVVCSQVVSPATSSVKMTEKEVIKLVQGFLEKKMLFSTIQAYCLLQSNPKAEGLSSEGIRTRYRKTPIVGDHKREDLSLYQDLINFGRTELVLNESDRANVEYIENKSVEVLERLLEIPAFEYEVRKSRIDNVRSVFVIKDSSDEILNALSEIRKLKNEDPAGYESFLAAWKATLPIMAKPTLQNINFDQGNHGSEWSAAFRTTFAGVLGASYYLGFHTPMHGGDVIMIGLLGAAGSAMFAGIMGAVAHDKGNFKPYGYLKSRFRAWTSATVRALSQIQVKRLAKKTLLMSQEKAQELLDRNTSVERNKLNELQDLNVQELMSRLKDMEGQSLDSPEAINRFQLLQMYLMSGLSADLSVMATRHSKIAEKVDEFVEKAEDLAKSSDDVKRARIKEITELGAQAYEFNLDVKRTSSFVKEATALIDSYLQQMQLMMKDPATSRETKDLIEQLLLQTSVTEGMQQALDGLHDQIARDIKTVTNLSLGIMAGQVSKTMKDIRARE